MPGTAMYESVPHRQSMNTLVVEPLPAPPPVLPAQPAPVSAQPPVLPAQPAPLPTTPGRESLLSTACIDDLLGPARGRYFGEGFRRVVHELRDVVVDTDSAGRGGVSALAWIRYPADWAVKRPGADLRPHVSSLDTLVIGAQLCEAFLAHRYRLDPGQRRRMWLRRIDVKSGQRPQEELAGFEVTAHLRDVRPLEDRPGRYASTFDCRIGTMRLRCEIGHEVTGAPPRPGAYADIDEVLGPAARRHLGTGYRHRRYEIRDVGVDPCDTYAVCAVRPAGGVPATVGLEAEYQPCVTMAESLAVMAQLAEVLLYRIDRLDRSRSNTMWLRSLRMERPDPATPRAGAQFTGSIAVSKSRVVELNGARWRIVDVVAFCEGIEITCSLAHELPESAGSPGRPGIGAVHASPGNHGGIE